MKHLKQLFLALFLFASATASAHSFEVDGIFYNTSGTTVSVTYKGDSYNEFTDEYSGVLKIPATVTYNGKTYSVTSIGSYAFNGCSGLTSIEIPNSVTSIGSFVFQNCSGLTSIEIPSSVTSIGNYAFSGCSGLAAVRISDLSAWLNIEFSPSASNPLYYAKNLYLNGEKITDLVIPNSVTSIGRYAFYGCSGLTSIEIPNSVTSIGAYAFSGCSGLAAVHISDLSAWCKINFGDYSANPLYCAKNLYLNGEKITDLVIPSSVTSISGAAFSGCSGLTSVEIPNSVTSIGFNAFYNCTGLTSVEIPNSVTSIGTSAFEGCLKLTSIEIPNSVAIIGSSTFYNCYGLKKIISHIPADKLITPGSTAFGNMSKTKCLLYVPKGAVGAYKATSGWSDFVIAEIGLEWSVADGVLTIEGDSVAVPDFTSSFSVPWNSEEFNKVVIGSGITRIGDYAFYKYPKFIRVEMPESATPLAVGASAFNGNNVIMVPANQVEAYKNDAAWSAYSLQICAAEYAEMALEVEAQESTSAVLAKIGDANTQGVIDLTIKGSINSYDIIVIRDKMPNLRYLDLSQATVVASNKAYHSGNCTGNNDLGDYVFSAKSKLISVKLPESLTRIGGSAFYGCSALESIEIPAGVTSIGTYAFSGCSALESVEIPAGVAVIDSRTFNNCKNLASVTIPSGVTSIAGDAFNGCSALKEIKLPPTVQTIAANAFYNCTSLKEVRLPSSLLSVAASVFSSCNAITDVYTYTIEPTSIQESTFTSTVYQNATLHVPTTSYWNYYWDEGWKRFLSLTYFDEPYEYFYLNNDYTLDEETGYIDGTPDVDINAGGGLIVEGETGDDEDVKQELGDVNVNNDGNGSSGSIIGDNNLQIDNLYIKINVKGGRWYFFAFPFDIPFSKISMENGSAYVFRYYDGEERAKKGNGGWKDINENHLKAARGYIFQCSANDVLVLNIENIRFKKEDKYNELVAHVTENLQDASWNFVGNPYLSYYDIDNLGYDAPITVWNGSTYEAIRPGDDDYCFTPFEAFFVQKPDGQESVEYSGDAQTTQQKAKGAKAANAARRVAVVGERKLVNITLNGDGSKDRTRVVLNPKQSLAYETACDAVKFESAGVAQLYTLDSKNVKYAINERPVDNGLVPVGVKFPSEGTYTITAERMDTTVWLKDAKTGAVHNLADGAYSFLADAGTDEARFSLAFIGGATGIDGVCAADAVAAVEGGIVVKNATGTVVEIYTAAGAVVACDAISGYVALPAGAYVVKIGGESIKVVVK